MSSLDNLGPKAKGSKQQTSALGVLTGLAGRGPESGQRLCLLGLRSMLFCLFVRFVVSDRALIVLTGCALKAPVHEPRTARQMTAVRVDEH